MFRIMVVMRGWNDGHFVMGGLVVKAAGIKQRRQMWRIRLEEGANVASNKIRGRGNLVKRSPGVRCYDAQ